MHELNVNAGAAKLPQAAGYALQAGAHQGGADQCFDDDHRHGVEEVGLGWEVDGGGEDAAVDGGGEEDGQEVDDEMVDVEVEEDEVQDVPSSGEEVDKAKDEMGAKGAKGVKGGKARYVAPWGKQRSHGSKADWIVSTDKWGGCRYNSGWYWLHGAWYPYPG